MFGWLCFVSLAAAQDLNDVVHLILHTAGIPLGIECPEAQHVSLPEVA